jgi:hypothetical protein
MTLLAWWCRLHNVQSRIICYLKGYLGNWPHYYRVVCSKLVFYNILTTSINNTHIKWKNLKTICSSETISSRIYGSAPNSPNTRCHFCDLVGLTLLWHSHRRVHSAGSTFTFFKLANCTHVACHVYTTRYLGNAMQRRFSISALGSVYDVAQTNLWCSLWTDQIYQHGQIWSLPPRLIIDRGFSVPVWS